jgi:hypothetical protein
MDRPRHSGDDAARLFEFLTTKKGGILGLPLALDRGGTAFGLNAEGGAAFRVTLPAEPSA